MSHVANEVIWEEQSLAYTADQRTYTQGFRIYFTAGSGAMVPHARAALGVIRGEAYPYDPLARVDSVSVVPDFRIIRPKGISFDCCSFRATVTYSTSERTKFENPCDEPPLRSWSPFSIEKSVTEDHEGKPLKTSAGELYLDITEPEYAWAFTWTKNIPKNVWNPIAYHGWLNRTNEGAFQGFPENTIKIVDISVGEQKQTIVDNKEFFYYAMTVAMQVKQIGTWKRRVLDAGLKRKYQPPDSDPQLVDIEVNGVPVTTPQLLDGEGDVLPEGEEPVWNEFQTVEMKNFASFPQEIKFV